MTTPVIDGAEVFELKATHGLPLSISLDIIYNDYKYKIDWVSFIEQARKNKWWDFQTYEEIENSLNDAGIDKQFSEEILNRIKLYILTNPLK